MDCFNEFLRSCKTTSVEVDVPPWDRAGSAVKCSVTDHDEGLIKGPGKSARLSSSLLIVFRPEGRSRRVH